MEILFGMIMKCVSRFGTYMKIGYKLCVLNRYFSKSLHTCTLFLLIGCDLISEIKFFS